MSRIVLLANVLNIEQGELIRDRYVLLANKLVKHKGYAHATKLLKQYYNCLKAQCLGCKIPNTDTWLKTNANGLPKCIERVINPLDTSKDDHARWLLSLFSLYETWKQERCMVDIHTLRSTRNVRLPAEVLRNLTRSFKSSIKRMKMNHMIKRLRNPPTDYLSLKGGPCGQATLTAHHDARKLLAEPLYFKKLALLNEKLGSTCEAFEAEIQSIAKLSTKDITNVPILKTLAIPDKGPKVRTITIGNYFLQRTLKPVHTALMETLRNIPEDGTYRQDKAAQLVKSWTGQGIQPWCFDLTSATDLFPVVIEYLAVKYIYPEIAYEWYSLMRKAKSYDTSRNKWFTFEVGQPMGLYSSWAAFSLAHHLIIRFAFSEVNADFRGQYAIIGDDVAIVNPKAAAKYEELILGIGVPISYTKSITPLNKVLGAEPSGELAKRYFRGGIEITPVRPYQLESLTGKGWPLLLEFIPNLINRWSGEKLAKWLTFDPVTLDAPFLHWVDKAHRKKFLLVALDHPLGAHINGVTPDWWPARDSLTYLYAYKAVYGYKISALVEQIHIIFERQNELLGSDTLPAEEQLHNHPLHKALKLRDEDAKKIYSGFDQEDLALEDIFKLGLNLDLLVSMITENKSFKDYKSLQLKRSAATAESALEMWAQATGEFEYKPKDPGYPQVRSRFESAFEDCYDF